mmetsp:Transcript_23081/g.58851  ORF Transcript_23081/g.58851 Transcript_23081/m.58851 type:complete len:307 (+) Transcript_23081:712-1632(+)
MSAAVALSAVEKRRGPLTISAAHFGALQSYCDTPLPPPPSPQALTINVTTPKAAAVHTGDKRASSFVLTDLASPPTKKSKLPATGVWIEAQGAPKMIHDRPVEPLRLEETNELEARDDKRRRSRESSPCNPWAPRGSRHAERPLLDEISRKRVGCGCERRADEPERAHLRGYPRSTLAVSSPLARRMAVAAHIRHWHAAARASCMRCAQSMTVLTQGRSLCVLPRAQRHQLLMSTDPGDPSGNVAWPYPVRFIPAATSGANRFEQQAAACRHDDVGGGAGTRRIAVMITHTHTYAYFYSSIAAEIR